MKNSYNGLRYVKTGLAGAKAWRWFCGLFKKKSNGVSPDKAKGVSQINNMMEAQYKEWGWIKDRGASPNPSV